jgi:multidrug resistance efflux pump
VSEPISKQKEAAPGSRGANATLSERVQSLRLPEKSPKRGTASTSLVWGFALATFTLAGASGLLGYLYYGATVQLAEMGASGAGDAGRPGDGAKGDGLRPSDGTSAQSLASSGDVVLERKGYVIPAHQILVSPKVNGMIMRLNIEEGMRVKKDEVLAEIETIDYLTDYQHARATAASNWQKFLELYTGYRDQEIRQAKADLDEMEANRIQLFADWKRSKRLTGSAMADRDFELAESLYRAMDRRVESKRLAYGLMLEGARSERVQAAWADFEQAEADASKAKWKLDNCKVRAPVSGTILSKEAEIGNLVNPIAFNGSFSLCKMADLSDMEVDMSIEERDVARVFKGQKCKVRPDAYPDRIYDGEVSRLMPTADRAKSAIPVRVKLKVAREEEGVYLKPDMSAVVSFLKKTEK